MKVASFHTGKAKVLAFRKAFHGRTSGAVAATDNPKIQAPFNATENIVFAPLNDLEAVAAELSKLLGQEVKLAKDVVGEDAKALAANLQEGEVMLLENVRYEAGEEKNDEELSKAFASLAEVFVNDAFGTAHRAHASTEGVAKHLPAVCGFLIEKELKALGDAIDNPKITDEVKECLEIYNFNNSIIKIKI